MLFQTDRLYLREFTMEDCSLILDLHSREEVQRWTGEPIIASLEEVQEKMQERTLHDYQTYGYGRWATFLKSNQASEVFRSETDLARKPPL